MDHGSDGFRSDHGSDGFRSAEDNDSMPSVLNSNSDDDGVPPPSAHPAAAIEVVPPPAPVDDVGVSEHKLDASSGSVHKDAPATDVPNAPPDGSDDGSSSSMMQERSKSSRSRAEKLSSRESRKRTTKHRESRMPRTKPTSEPIPGFDPVQAQMSQLMQMVTALAKSNQANNDALSARMDDIQEQSAKRSQSVKPAESAVAGKDGVKESDPPSEIVESSDDSRGSSSNSTRSYERRGRHKRYFKALF